jgi:hypothetical protein
MLFVRTCPAQCCGGMHAVGVGLVQVVGGVGRVGATCVYGVCMVCAWCVFVVGGKLALLGRVRYLASGIDPRNGPFLGYSPLLPFTIRRALGTVGRQACPVREAIHSDGP